MGHEHSHAQQVAGNEKLLTWALALTGTFLVVEVIGGIVTQSLALLSDAAHMFTDTTALAIALVAIRIGKRAVDARRTYGYQRFEILAAAFNALLLFGVAGWILYEAYSRFVDPAPVNSTGMLAVASVGLAVNLVSMKLLSAGSAASLNVKGAYLEVWSDMLGSLGVIVGAILIRYTGWLWVDPAIAVAIGLWVLPRTWTLLKESTNILLEGTPSDVDSSKVRAALEGGPGVKMVHDLHIWTLTSGRHVLTAHVVVEPSADREILLRALSENLKSEFKLFHTTLQIESEACDDMHGAVPAAASATSHDKGGGHTGHDGHDHH